MWKTIEFYRRTNIIDLSYRTLMRKIGKVRGMSHVVKKKVINGTETLLINYDYVDKYFTRKRKLKTNIECFNEKMEKKVRKINSTYKVPKNIDSYTIELSINFKDNYDREYYLYIVKDLFLRSSFDMFFVIEQDSEGYNHLHIGVRGQLEELKTILKHTYSNLHLHDYDADKDELFCKQTNIATIRNYNSYSDYVNKDFPIEFLLKSKNLKLFDDGK